VFGHVPSATARLLPIERLAAVSHERGVQMIVNAVHSSGLVPAKVSTLGDDYLTGNIHKWMGVPRGKACVFASSKRRAGPKLPQLSSRESEGLLHAFGHVGKASQAARRPAPADIEFFEDFGWDAARRRNNGLACADQLLLLAEVVGSSLEGASGDDTGDYARPTRLIPPDIAPGDGSGDVCATPTDRLALEHVFGYPAAARNTCALLRVYAQPDNSQAGCERLAEPSDELF
jgi:hypothetical protein